MARLRCGSCVLVVVTLVASASAEPPAAKDYLAFWGPLVGNWKITVQAADKTHEGEWKLNPADNQTCLVGQAKIAGLIAASTLEGFDPESRGWQRLWFDGQGGYQRDQVTVDNIKQSKLESGTVVRVDTTLVPPEGGQNKKSYASHWRFTKVEPDGLEVVVTKGPLGPEATLTLTRIK